jgi:hypothetical protein
MCDTIEGSILVAFPFDRPEGGPIFGTAFADVLRGQVDTHYEWDRQILEEPLFASVAERLQSVFERYGSIRHKDRLSDRVAEMASNARTNVDRYECRPGTEDAISRGISDTFHYYLLQLAPNIGARISSNIDDVYVEPERMLSLAAIPMTPVHDNAVAALTYGLLRPSTTRPVVAVVDSGADASANYYFASRNYGGDRDSFDSEGHGTVVAQIVRSICPDANVVSAKITTGKRVAEADVLAALSENQIATAAVINLSLQFGLPDLDCPTCGVRRSRSSCSRIFERILEPLLDDDVAVVCAAGNKYAMNGLPTTEELAFPARFARVIAVGAVDSTNALSDISRFGPCTPGYTHPNLVFAPGGSYARNEHMATSPVSGVLRGTSMSTAYVSGILAQRIATGDAQTGADAFAQLATLVTPVIAPDRAVPGLGCIDLPSGFL